MQKALPISGTFDPATGKALQQFLNSNWKAVRAGGFKRTKKLSGSSFNGNHVKALTAFLNERNLVSEFGCLFLSFWK